MKQLVVILLLGLLSNTILAQLMQNISGKVVDAETGEPLPFVNLYLKDLDPLVGTSSDIEGAFIIKDVPIGRVSVVVSSLGYQSLMVTEIQVTSAKQVQLDIRLTPTLSQLEEVVIKPTVYKQHPINNMAMVSARMLSVEEASRYAGGFDDPARLAASFAGVASSNGGSNAIVIRGNAPKFIQWKLEGVEIPNPNHFANLSSFGGGGLTALSSNLLANSDFITGAFPAEYNNALSGVFDINIRNGSTLSHEHSIEAGLLGIDLASEGPLKNGGRSSYLANYRYSTLGLLSALMPEDAEGTQYQDLSFKLNFPTDKSGTFSVWGIGLIDNSGTTAERDPGNWNYYQDIEDQKVAQYMGSAGVNHQYFFQKDASINSTIAISNEGMDLSTNRLNEETVIVPQNHIKTNNYNLTLKSVFSKKLSHNLHNLTGFTLTGLGYSMDLKETQGNAIVQPVAYGDGFTSLVAAYTNFTVNQVRVKLNLGLTYQLFTLNDNYTIEPRLGISYKLNESKGLSFSYGLHSRLEPLHIYFANTSNPADTQANKKLDFTRAHHFVLAYDWDLSESLHLKVEPYYQALYEVPVVEGENKSLLNQQGEWFVTDTFLNRGNGRNYGLDLTLEQYLHKGFYYLISGSVFNSQYKSDVSDWFNTRYNKNFLFNALAGKEFNTGKTGQNTLGINIRVSIQGGDRYSKIDYNASSLKKDVVYATAVPFSEQTAASAVLHTTVSYQWNRIKTTHKLSLRILNATGYEEFMGHRYNIKTGGVDEFRETLMIPNLSYRIWF